MEKGLKYPQSIGNGTKLPSIHLLAPKYPSHPPIGSKIPLSSTFWFKVDHLFNGFIFKLFKFFLKYVALNYLL